MSTAEINTHYCKIPVVNQGSKVLNAPSLFLKTEVKFDINDIVENYSNVPGDSTILHLTALESRDNEGQAWVGQLSCNELKKQAKQINNIDFKTYHHNCLIALKCVRQHAENEKKFVYQVEYTNGELCFTWKLKLNIGLAKYGVVHLRKASYVECCLQNFESMSNKINYQDNTINDYKKEIELLTKDNKRLIELMNNLVREKKDHEMQLFAKFVCILNEKKADNLINICPEKTNLSTSKNMAKIVDESVKTKKRSKNNYDCSSKNIKTHNRLSVPGKYLDAGDTECISDCHTNDYSKNLSTIDLNVDNDPYLVDTQIDSLETPASPIILQFIESSSFNIACDQQKNALQDNATTLYEQTKLSNASASLIQPDSLPKLENESNKLDTESLKLENISGSQNIINKLWSGLI